MEWVTELANQNSIFVGGGFILWHDLEAIPYFQKLWEAETMGDKSPKSNKKNDAQKQTKAGATQKKKNDASAAKQVPKK